MISRSTGGNWRFNISIESTEPDEDDTIYVFSPLNTTSMVSFKLFNKNNHLNEYNAYFTADSDPEFSISPKMGEIMAYTNGPQWF